MSDKVKSTSRQAYRDHVISGRALSQREKILNFLERHQLPRNRREISHILGIPINAVTGRVNALIENGDLRVAYVDEDPVTGKRVEYIELMPSGPKQKRMF
jgi:predicted transcriptional regulator